MRKSYRESSVIQRFGQWVVTKFGVECSERYYPIERSRLNEVFDKSHSWEYHMAGKTWVNMREFTEAITYAREHPIK